MNEMPAKPITLWKKPRGPFTANQRMIELASAINHHLTAPLDVLPVSIGATVKPFAIGISPSIEARMKPDASLSELKLAIRKYTRNRFYMLASAQHGAMRHDIDGIPVEPVSYEHRLAAKVTWMRMQEAIEKRRKEEQEQAAA